MVLFLPTWVNSGSSNAQMLLHCELVCKKCMKTRQIFNTDSWGREDVSVGGLLPVQVCSSVLSLEKKSQALWCWRGIRGPLWQPLWPDCCISGPSERHYWKWGGQLLRNYAWVELDFHSYVHTYAHPPTYTCASAHTHTLKEIKVNQAYLGSQGIY